MVLVTSQKGDIGQRPVGQRLSGVLLVERSQFRLEISRDSLCHRPISTRYPQPAFPTRCSLSARAEPHPLLRDDCQPYGPLPTLGGETTPVLLLWR